MQQVHADVDVELQYCTCFHHLPIVVLFCLALCVLMLTGATLRSWTPSTDEEDWRRAADAHAYTL